RCEPAEVVQAVDDAHRAPRPAWARRRSRRDGHRIRYRGAGRASVTARGRGDRPGLQRPDLVADEHPLHVLAATQKLLGAHRDPAHRDRLLGAEDLGFRRGPGDVAGSYPPPFRTHLSRHGPIAQTADGFDDDSPPPADGISGEGDTGRVGYQHPLDYDGDAASDRPVNGG